MKKLALLALAGYLPAIPAEEFNQSYWKRVKRVTGQEGPQCKTVACAAGHAVIAGIAPRGLRFTPYSKFASEDEEFSGLKARANGYDLRDFEAIAAKYDIPEEDADRLFSGKRDGHSTRRQVAENIRLYAIDPANENKHWKSGWRYGGNED